MKFGKRLKKQMEETLPEWRAKFLGYKDLKRLVRRISATQPTPTPETESEFVQLLNAEVDKFNAFFVEQEEEFIIRQRELQDRIKKGIDGRGPSGGGDGVPQRSEANYVTEMWRIRKDVVNLHGEMVLLENYSSINYTGLAKILKKYDKRTGGLLRLPFIEMVLKQPFFTTDIISKMVKECEIIIEAVLPVVGVAEHGHGDDQLEASVSAEQSIFRNAVVALMTMQELRRGSSTYGHFSLPPLSLPDADLHFFQLPSPITIL